MSEQEAWTMVNKISGLIEERDSLRERVAFLVAEAHGWQPRLEAAEAEVARLRRCLHREEQMGSESIAQAKKLRVALDALQHYIDGLGNADGVVVAPMNLSPSTAAPVPGGPPSVFPLLAERNEWRAKYYAENTNWTSMYEEARAAEARVTELEAAGRQWLSETGPGQHVNTAKGRYMMQRALYPAALAAPTKEDSA